MKQTKSSNGADLIPGQRLELTGDVTQLFSLVNASGEEIEKRLGYEAGRLSPGWYLLLLVDPIRINDFTWGGTTEGSGGTDRKNLEEFNGETMRVPVEAIKRLKFRDQMGGDGSESDAMFDSFRARQLHLLNDRRSPNRIAKVLPLIRHDKRKFWLTQYPDAAPNMGVRQWTIQKPKQFVVSARIGRGQIYVGGGVMA